MTYIDSATYSQSATTKRNPAAAAGKVGVPVTHLTSLKIRPLIPAPPALLERYKLQSPRNIFTTAAEGTPDVRIGDTLTTGGVDYRIAVVAQWTGPVTHTRLIIEQVHGT